MIPVKLCKNRGFTLVETMVTAMLLAILVEVFSILFLSTQKANLRSQVLIDLQQQARNGMEQLTNELSVSTVAQVVAPIPTPCGNECYGEKIVFRVPVVTGALFENTIFTNNLLIKWGADGFLGNQITYMAVKNPGGADDHHLVRQTPTSTRTITANIKELAFLRDENVIECTVTAEKFLSENYALSIPLKSAVLLKN